MNGNPLLLIKSDLIIGKGNEFSTFNQKFSFVENQLMHAKCHLPTTCVQAMGFWKVFNIKEMQ
jgi:hypothetical protein